MLPGKEEQARQFGREVSRKSKEWKDSEKRLKIKQEAWFLQSSPTGSMIIIYVQTDDIARLVRDFAKATNPFDVWYKDQAKQITGVDFNDPLTGPLPEVLFSYGY